MVTTPLRLQAFRGAEFRIVRASSCRSCLWISSWKWNPGWHFHAEENTLRGGILRGLFHLFEVWFTWKYSNSLWIISYGKWNKYANFLKIQRQLISTMIVKDHMNRTRKWVKISENVGRHFGKKGARKCIEECFIVLPGAKEREREGGRRRIWRRFIVFRFLRCTMPSNLMIEIWKRNGSFLLPVSYPIVAENNGR